MVIVAITKSLDKKLKKQCNKAQYQEIKKKLLTLKKDPYEGKLLHVLGNVVLKELKWDSFRCYFLTSHNLIKFVSTTDLEKELIKFIQLSKKSDQTRVIQEIMEQLKQNKDFL